MQIARSQVYRHHEVYDEMRHGKTCSGASAMDVPLNVIFRDGYAEIQPKVLAL